MTGSISSSTTWNNQPTWNGSYTAQTAAKNELLLHSAAAFVLIVLLLALAFGQSRHVLLVLLSLPSTLIGGVAAAAIYFGVKAAYRNKQVGRKRPDRELPRQQAPDVDDELTRLRREMRS